MDLGSFRATDREQCGVIIEKNKVLRVVEVTNAAENDDDYAIFESDFQKVKASLKKGESIYGFFHTHLPHHSAEPSANDIAGAKKYPDFLSAVYKPSTEELLWYDANSGIR